MTNLRMLLHVAAQRDNELHSLDFNTAFLQGSLHEEISLRRPPGFTGTFLAGTQWSLRRLVYDLRQKPRKWHDTLRTTLAALGFTPSTTDPSLFLRTDTSLPPLYVLVYVDDLVFATADTKALTLVKSELQKRHTCTNLDELRSYLGLQVTRDRARRTITLTQSYMVHQILQRFGFQFSSPQPTPRSTSHSLSAPPSDESVEPSGPYLELVGFLILPCQCGDSRSNSGGLSSSSGSGSSTGGRSCSSGASEVLSVGAAATARLVPAFVAGSGATSPTERLSFTLDSGASSSFIRDCTDLTPLHTLVTVALADPSVGSVVAESTTTLSYPAAPSGFLTAPPPSRPAPSGVSHVTPQSFPPQRLVPVMSGDAGGAVAEGEGTGAAGACCASFGGAGGVRVETTPKEDTAVSTQGPCHDSAAFPRLTPWLSVCSGLPS
ncbi:unnamed protein product [Closterium sp. NIES-54]